MKKLFLLFVMCLTAVMASASGFDLQHRTKLYPGLRKAAMDSVSSGGTHAGNAQDTIRINVENGISVYSQLDEEGNKMYIFLAEVDSSQILITANMEELVSGVYSSLEGFYLAPGQTPVYGLSGSVDLQVGYAITTVVGTFLGSDGNVYVVSGHFPTPRMYTISVLPPSCGNYVPAIISPVITDAKLTMSYNANSGWYTASFVGIPGVEYAIVDNANEENVPIYEENGNWWPMFGPGNLFRLGDTTTLYFNWSDTTEYKWYSCMMQDPGSGDVDYPIEDNYIVFWNMNVSHGSQGMTLTASNELFSIQLAFRNVHELMPGFYTSQQNMFNLTNCWIQDAEIGQREKAQQIDAEIRDNNGQMMVEATIITQTGKMFQVRLLQQEIITPVDPNPGDSTEILPGDTTTQQPIDTTSQQPITPSERDYTIRLLPPSGNYLPAILFSGENNPIAMQAGNNGWYDLTISHTVDYSYQSFMFVSDGNSNNYIERNVWGEWYDMSAGIAYDDTTSVMAFNYNGENYRWHADAPVVVPDTVNLVFTNNFTTRDYGTDIAFYSSNSEYAAQFDIYMNGITAGTYSSANGDFDMSYTVVQTSSDYYTAAEAEATLSIEGDVIYLTGKIVANNGNVYLISMQKSTVSQTFVINCEDDFAYREYAEDDMVVAAATEDYYVQLNFATNNIRGGLYSNEDFLMQYTAIFTADRTPITAASSIIASVSIENGVTSINAELRGMDDNIYQITMHGVLPNTEVVPGGNDSTEVVPGGNDSTIVVPGDSVAPGTRNYMVRIAAPACGSYQPALYFEEDQQTVPMTLENSGWYRAILNHEIDYSYHSFYVVENNNPGNKIEMNAWVEWTEASAGIVYDDTTSIISLNYSDTIRFRWSACVEEPVQPGDSTIIVPGDSTIIVPGDSTIIVPGDSCETTLWEGEEVMTNNGTSLLSEDGHELFEAGAEAGDYVRFYMHSDRSLSCWLDVFEGHWDSVYKEYYSEAFEGEYVELLLTESILDNLRRPTQYWGSSFVLIGDNLTLSRLSLIKAACHANEPDPNTVVINCEADFTHDGSTSDHYFYGDSEDGYHVQFNIRTNNLQPGTYTVDRFWTGQYTFVRTPNGTTINSASVSAVVTEIRRRTHVELTMIGVDGKTYIVSMTGCNPADPNACKDTIELTFDDSYYSQRSNSDMFTIWHLLFSYADGQSYSSRLNFDYQGEVFGENTPYISGKNNFYAQNNDTVYFNDFTTTFTHREDHKTVAQIEGMGSDSLHYIIKAIFTSPYPHEYTISVLPPTCGDYVPVLISDERIPMTYNSVSGAYTATFQSTEGAYYSFADADTLHALNSIERGTKHLDYWGYESNFNFDLVYDYLGQDTVLLLDFRHPTLIDNPNSIDTVFYRWTACGDNYSHEVAEPSEAGFGLLVVKEHTLDAAEAETLSPANVHLSYDRVFRSSYSAPTHGQLLVSDSVEMHMGRFVKSDAWGRRSPYSKARYGETYFDYNWDGISSAMINNGTMTADTVEQHTLFYTEIWHFMALPFDVKRSEIELEDGAYVAVRRFLPAEQAEGNYDDVWEDLAPNDTIHAGEGYIYHFYKVGHSYDASGSASGASSEEPWRYGIDMAEAHFKALHTANKQQMFAKGDQHIALKHQPADRIWNKNWNLISNPYQSFYNVYNCGGQGIITVYSNDDRTTEYGGSYEYVSLNDDYYVLQPGQAFFYQAADNEQQLTFPAAGQQMTAQPDGFEPGYAPMAPQRGNAGREIYNFYLSDEQQEDRARVVINESAQMDYELGRDALKLTPLELTNALFYAEDEQVEMAISERPLGDGVVYFSAKLPQDGTFSIRMDEKAGAKVMLLDTETGVMTDLTEGAYIFTETAGTYSRRFIISITGQETAIHNALNKQKDTAIKVLENNNVYIIRGGEKYDVLGKKY